MKKFYSLIAILLFAAGCNTSSKLMQRGRFEAALERSVKELRRNPTNADEILVLERAYRIQNERDWERINFLKLNNDPRHLEELITLYTRLKDRQSLVRTVLPLNLPDRVINYPYINYDEEIVAARFAAADYYYNNALQLMDQGDKASYRQAHLEFQRVKRYSTTHRDIDRMIQDSKLLGISRVLVMVQNHTPLNFRNRFSGSVAGHQHQGT
jgi:tetratricopeptide (TPR) repeat protein